MKEVLNPGEKRIGYLYVLAAAVLWGSFAPLAKALYTLKAPVLAVAFLRPMLAFLILLAILLVKQKAYLKVARRDIPLLVVQGLFGIALFNFFFLYTIDIGTIVTAVFLLYSAPIFVTLISRFAFGEPLVRLKIVALVSSILGLALLLEVYRPAVLKIPLVGIATGLGAGLTYALFSLLGKAALARYSHWTVLVYAMGFGSLFLSFGGAWAVKDLPSTFGVISLLAITGIFHTLTAYTLYTWGLRSVEASRASILTTVEPLVASLIGLSFFAEEISPIQAFGGALVILGAILTQVKT